jgi:hypothetical protein
MIYDADKEARRIIRRGLAEGRRETRRLKDQGLSDEAIMRIWEHRSGVKWDEASQTHIPIAAVKDEVMFPAPPKRTITLRDGSVIAIGQPAPATIPAQSTVVAVVQVGRRRAYQKNDLGQWWQYRGKRGWTLVRKEERIRELEAFSARMHD